MRVTQVDHLKLDHVGFEVAERHNGRQSQLDRSFKLFGLAPMALPRCQVPVEAKPR